jgi:hypothetical protein
MTKCKCIKCEWIKDDYDWRMIHSTRLSITKTRFGEFRVWDYKTSDTITIEPTLQQAKKEARIYYQTHC